MTRFATLLVTAALGATACGGDQAAVPADPPGEKPRLVESSTPGTVTRGDSSTDLSATPLSAADYQMYAAIMGGASALLSTLSPADTEALEFAKQVDSGTTKVTPATEALLARARALQARDVELARMQGIESRYLAVKEKVEAVIGPKATPPADALARENLRYLEAHRTTIERLQKILADPLSRPPGPTSLPAE